MIRWFLPLMLATAAPHLAGVNAAQGSCDCESWDLGTPGLRWSGGASPGPAAAKSVSVCQKMCCDANQAGTCVAYSYDQNAAEGQACTIWTTAPQQQATEPGWTSGTLSSPAECGLLAQNRGVLVAAVLVGGTFLYFACGIAFKKLNAPRDFQTQRPTTDVPEWLPHQQFWYSLGGLVVDGVMCCARCGQPNAPPGVAKHDPDLATSFLTTDDELRRNSWATPPGSPNPAGLPAGGRASTGTMSPSMSPNTALL